MANKKQSAEAAQQRRELFVRAYIANGQHAAEAWITAGGSAKGARQSAFRVLQEPAVKAMLQAHAKKQLEQADITAERVMMELGRRALADVRDCFGPDGKLLPIAEMSNDAAASIDGIEIEVDKQGRPTTVKIKRAGKDAALGILARHFKIAGHEIDEAVGKLATFADRLTAARERELKRRK